MICDCDTVGCIAGAIAGSYYGEDDPKYMEILKEKLPTELFEDVNIYIDKIKE